MRELQRGRKTGQMENLFRYVWLLILAWFYIHLWKQVLADIKWTRKNYKFSETYRHLSPFSKKWIVGHIIILFLMSYSAWEGQ